MYNDMALVCVFKTVALISDNISAKLKLSELSRVFRYSKLVKIMYYLYNRCNTIAIYVLQL